MRVLSPEDKARLHLLRRALEQRIPASIRATVQMRVLGLFKIPLIFFVSPTVREMTDDRCVVRIPLNRRTRNHLGSMYFGTLAVGADVAGGTIAWKICQERDPSISLVFKDFQAEFLKRPEADVDFICEEGSVIRALVEQAQKTGERVSAPINITAYCPARFGEEPVARFKLTISLKKLAK